MKSLESLVRRFVESHPQDAAKALEELDTAEAAKIVENLPSRLAGAVWLSLIDPEPRPYDHPPWALQPGLERVGLSDRHMEPKEHVEAWLKEIRSVEPRDGTADFIDISPEEYGDNPQTHLTRLWHHFRESS